LDADPPTQGVKIARRMTIFTTITTVINVGGERAGTRVERTEVKEAATREN
jgi:hypothetical protein